MLETLSSLFTEVNLLLFIPLIIFLSIWLIIGMAQPICVFVDCLDSDLSWQKKLFWLTAMILSLGLASFLYPWFNKTGRVLRVADRVMISPLLALLAIYVVLYIFHSGVREFINRQLLNLLIGIGHLFSIG